MTDDQQATVLRYYRMAGSYALRRYGRVFRSYGTEDDLCSIAVLALCYYVVSGDPSEPGFRRHIFDHVRKHVFLFMEEMNGARIFQAKEDRRGTIDFADRRGPDDLPDFPALCGGIPDDQAEVLWGVYGEGLTPKEIADRMGIPPWKVHNLLQHGRFSVKENARRLGVA